MSPIYLTEGAIAMLSGGGAASNFRPVLQVADVRLANNQNNNNERYRILLSDGVFAQQGMLATQLNNLLRSEKLRKGSIIQLTQFVSNLLRNCWIIVVIDLNILIEKCDPIGELKPYDPTTIGGMSLSGQTSTTTSSGGKLDFEAVRAFRESSQYGGNKVYKDIFTSGARSLDCGRKSDVGSKRRWENVVSEPTIGHCPEKSLIVSDVNHSKGNGSYRVEEDKGLAWKKSNALLSSHDLNRFGACSDQDISNTTATSCLQERVEEYKEIADQAKHEVETLKDKIQLVQAENKGLVEKLKLECATGNTFLSSDAGLDHIKTLVNDFRKSKEFEKECMDRAMELWDNIVLDCQRVLRESGRVPEDLVHLLDSCLRNAPIAQASAANLAHKGGDDERFAQ